MICVLSYVGFVPSGYVLSFKNEMIDDPKKRICHSSEKTSHYFSSSSKTKSIESLYSSQTTFMDRIMIRKRYISNNKALSLVHIIFVASWFSTTSCTTQANVLRLQSPHVMLSPTETLEKLSNDCTDLNIVDIDVYGDFQKTPDESFLRQFEQEIAHDFEKEDAVFMPSGVMAQQIALLIHSRRSKEPKSKFICHPTSHLMLHEQEGYQELCGLEAIPLPTLSSTGIHASPLLFDDVFHSKDILQDSSNCGTLMLELPHRELGGKLTPWQDIIKLKNFLKAKDIAFHCDGARIMEATAGYGMSLPELTKPFDSVYLSFYKGLASPFGGAMLLGDKKFCEQARIWLRRFGGNIYSLLPYAVAGWSGYRKYWKDQDGFFHTQLEKLSRITQELSSSDTFSQVASFEPKVAVVNMVHCYLRPSLTDCMEIRDQVKDHLGVEIFHRVAPLDDKSRAYKEGFRCRLEIYMGEANGSIDDEIWVQAWLEFCKRCLEKEEK